MFFGNLIQHLVSFDGRSDIPLQHLSRVRMRSILVKWHSPAETAGITLNQTDLQSREEGQQRVHPGASRKQRFMDMNVQQQWRLTNVLHYGGIVLDTTYRV